MSSAEFWFDGALNTTKYGGFTDEEILDLGPPVWAQRPFEGTGPGFQPKTKIRYRAKMVSLIKKCH